MGGKRESLRTQVRAGALDLEESEQEVIVKPVDRTVNGLALRQIVVRRAGQESVAVSSDDALHVAALRQCSVSSTSLR